MGTLSLFIVDDHQIVREGLRALVDVNIPNCEVVGSAENGRDALRKIRRLKPDIVVMDISMPDLNGIDATKLIVNAVPECRVIALSMHGSANYVTQMLSAGATAYLQKDVAFSELAAAIESVMQGKVFLGEGVATILVDDYRRMQNEPEGVQEVKLSPREREVVQLIAEGCRTKEIADRLSLSVKTVESHRTRVMKKLDLNNVAELTKYAIRAGITDLET